MIFLIIILALFFALNMGSAGFATSFAASYGGHILSRKKSFVLFLLFVILGALLLGQKVSITLGKNLISPDILTEKALMIIFLTAGMSMYLSNLLHIPQSTSLVTVAAICGVGTYYHQLNLKTLYFMLPFWLLLPFISFFLTLLIAYWIYPPRNQNFWLYERLINHEAKLKIFVIIASCYNAFSVGTNNVANAAGPIIGFYKEGLMFYLMLFGLFYGLGALLFRNTLDYVSKEIVPLGLMTASVISLVSGTLMIVASIYGVPQSFVMLQMGAIFAILYLKEGKEVASNHPVLKKALYSWTLNPILTFLITLALSNLIL